MSGSDEHFKLAVGIAIEGMKAGLYVNAGAATALIALMEKGQNPRAASCAIITFGLGAVVSVLAFGGGYFSQLNYANHRLAVEKGNAESASQALSLHRRWQWVTIFLTTISICLGVCAMGVVAFANVHF